MNIISFNLVISAILLIPYAVKADVALETLDASGTRCSTKLSLCELDHSKLTGLGIKGDKGDTGPRGEKGSCVCRGGGRRAAKERESLGADLDDLGATKPKPEWGTSENPGQTTCKNAPIDKTGTYYVYNSMEVKCDVIRKTTCVVINALPPIVSLNDTKPSWLSSTGFEYGDIYNLSNSQLKWLKERSDTASMKIRYHCVNTIPTRKDGEVLLLSWNDAIIASRPTTTSPFHYDVENDGCSTAREGFWAYTDIVIKNTSAHRLPIIDFYVQDIVKKDQEHKITVTELCFY